VKTKNIQTVRAKSAAFYLFQYEDCDPVLWHGLEDRGIDDDVILDRTGPLALRSVVFDLDSRRFNVDPLGEKAYLHIVHSEDDPSRELDIVAWSAQRPNRYGTYFGYAGLLGGDAVLNPASYPDSPCPIWATPMAWLQSGLKGCVVLNAPLAAPIIARAPGMLQCEDVVHARWLVGSGAVVIEKLMVPRRSAA